MTMPVESCAPGVDPIVREAALLLFASESRSKPLPQIAPVLVRNEFDRERADLLAGIADRLSEGESSDEVASVHRDLLRHLISSFVIGPEPALVQ